MHKSILLEWCSLFTTNAKKCVIEEKINRFYAYYFVLVCSDHSHCYCPQGLVGKCHFNYFQRLYDCVCAFPPGISNLFLIPFIKYTVYDIFWSPGIRYLYNKSMMGAVFYSNRQVCTAIRQVAILE